MKKRWGSYKVLAEGKDFKVKLLEIKPKSATSIQKHFKRSEYWFFLDNKDSMRKIAIGQIHQLINPTNRILRVLEIQLGECKEKDIKRYSCVKNRQEGADIFFNQVVTLFV